MDELVRLKKFDREKDLIKLGYRHDVVAITNKDIEALKKGKIVGFYDGEYTHRLIYCKGE